jgi:hypothetical protein
MSTSMFRPESGLQRRWRRQSTAAALPLEIAVNTAARSACNQFIVDIEIQPGHSFADGDLYDGTGRRAGERFGAAGRCDFFSRPELKD